MAEPHEGLNAVGVMILTPYRDPAVCEFGFDAHHALDFFAAGAMAECIIDLRPDAVASRHDRSGPIGQQFKISRHQLPALQDRGDADDGPAERQRFGRNVNGEGAIWAQEAGRQLQVAETVGDDSRLKPAFGIVAHGLILP